ncbi:Uncharacterised protein [Serratia fonticola]|uniref:AMP-dependent synthetase/ligase domain-containing protein n=1 Tax=Serratia fonticola TaxID=47917 RepID=A0A4U9W9V7_SERFO|nr:Uncharacterised protein [Serratia fonticola]
MPRRFFYDPNSQPWMATLDPVKQSHVVSLADWQLMLSNADDQKVIHPVEPAAIVAEDIAAIIYTSGTTGSRKEQRSLTVTLLRLSRLTNRLSS